MDNNWSAMLGGYKVPYDPRAAISQLASNATTDSAWDELFENLHLKSGTVQPSRFISKLDAPGRAIICKNDPIADIVSGITSGFGLPVQYDLPIILELCDELGVSAYKVSETEIELSLGEGLILCFQNIDDDDCLIGFKGMPSHTHGNVDFGGQGGYGVTLHYLDVVTGLVSRQLLICELWRNDVLADRYLLHAKYNDEFNYMAVGERIVVKIAEHGSSKSP